MFKKISLLLCFCALATACSLKHQPKQQALNLYSAKANNFAEVSSVFKVELDEKLGEGSSLLLAIDYDSENSLYTIKVLGAFASVLLKAQYDLNTFTYLYKPQPLENKQVQEFFEQTIKALLDREYLKKYTCSLNECSLTLGTNMFKNKYLFNSYNEEGFAQKILCSYRRGVIKISLDLLKIR